MGSADVVDDAARVRDALRALARLSRVLESADSGLTVPQFRMLCALGEGGERSARLAERLAVRKPTVTALADGLIAAGYAARESEPGDRRIVRLSLTDAGRAALERADAAYLARLQPLLAEVPDPERLIGGLLAIGDALDARFREGAPGKVMTEAARSTAMAVRG
jgi:DNA-binding MarR family transcriptional regulator